MRLLHHTLGTGLLILCALVGCQALGTMTSGSRGTFQAVLAQHGFTPTAPGVLLHQLGQVLPKGRGQETTLLGGEGSASPGASVLPGVHAEWVEAPWLRAWRSPVLPASDLSLLMHFVGSGVSPQRVREAMRRDRIVSYQVSLHDPRVVRLDEESVEEAMLRSLARGETQAREVRFGDKELLSGFIEGTPVFRFEQKLYPSPPRPTHLEGVLAETFTGERSALKGRWPMTVGVQSWSGTAGTRGVFRLDDVPPGGVVRLTTHGEDYRAKNESALPGRVEFVIPQGNYVVSLLGVGGFVPTQSVSVQAGAAGQASLKKPGWLAQVVTDPPGADLYVDDIFCGKTPLQPGPMTGGEHRLRLVMGGFKEAQRNCVVANGLPTEVDVIRLEAEPRILEIAVKSVRLNVGPNEGASEGIYCTWRLSATTVGGVGAGAVVAVEDKHLPEFALDEPERAICRIGGDDGAWLEQGAIVRLPFDARTNEVRAGLEFHLFLREEGVVRPWARAGGPVEGWGDGEHRLLLSAVDCAKLNAGQRLASRLNLDAILPEPTPEQGRPHLACVVEARLVE